MISTSSSRYGGKNKTELKQQFIERWNKYFPGVALPIAFYYSDSPGPAKLFRTSTQHCMIEDLAPITKGESLCFDTKSVACFGGKQCLGFTHNQMPNIEYFLSCGIPGKLEGERLVKSPELAKELINYMSTFTAPGKFLVFKRWDYLEEGDDPQVVIFFAQPEVLSGLYMLANFDEPSGEAVFCPWGSGCSSIVQFPLKECRSDHPRAVFGMFDVSARMGVDPTTLTISIPMKKFERVVDNMDESFLITGAWEKVKDRLRISRIQK